MLSRFDQQVYEGEPECPGACGACSRKDGKSAYGGQSCQVAKRQDDSEKEPSASDTE